MSQKLDARLLPDSMAIERLSWCCSTRTIGDLRLISDEIVARLAYERALFQPWPYLGQERCRRCRGPLRCLLLVILPAAMTAVFLDRSPLLTLTVSVMPEPGDGRGGRA